MTVVLAAGRLPALGDLRALGVGDVVLCRRNVRTDPQWARYTEAIAAAVCKGAAVSWES